MTDRMEYGDSIGESVGEIGFEADRLTGLPLVSEFFARAQKAVEASVGENVSFKIAYFNIVNMKLYNELFGLAAGDDLLRFAGRTIAESFSRALVARIGDDRFVLFTGDENLEEGLERVHQSIFDFNDSMRVSVRIGLYEYDGEIELSLACDRAKLACDHIKGRYDEYYFLYDDSLMDAWNRKQLILNKFGVALDEGHIQVHLQPILRTIDAKVTELEALARWIDPDEGFISPGEFIPVLEEARIVHLLDLRIIEMVCQFYGNVLAAGHPLVPVNVNLSRLDMELCDIVGETSKIARSYDVPSKMLNIELTESAFERNPDLLKGVIDGFHELGHEVWMDDFGSGYSSLNVLREFPFDVVKFDMSFLRSSNEESRAKSRSMIPYLITMVKALGIQTLAEGVETEEQFSFLKDMGCEKLQGFLFSPARSEGDITQMIAAGEFEVETRCRATYMDQVGHIDLMAPAEINRSLSSAIGLSSGLPSAIVEFTSDSVRYLAWNSSYLDYLRDIGMDTIENSTRQMNDHSRPQSQGFFAASKKLRGKDEWLNIAFYEGDDLCTGQAHCIAVDDESDTCAFVYIAFNVSRFLAQAGHTLRKDDVQPAG